MRQFRVKRKCSQKGNERRVKYRNHVRAAVIYIIFTFVLTCGFRASNSVRDEELFTTFAAHPGFRISCKKWLAIRISFSTYSDTSFCARMPTCTSFAQYGILTSFCAGHTSAKLSASVISYIATGCDIPSPDEQLPSSCREPLHCRSDEMLYEVPATIERTVTFWSRPRRVCLPIVSQQLAPVLPVRALLNPFRLNLNPLHSVLINPSVVARRNDYLYLYRLTNAKRCEMASYEQSYGIDRASEDVAFYWSDIVLCEKELHDCKVLDTSLTKRFTFVSRGHTVHVNAKGHYRGPEDARGVHVGTDLYVFFNLEVRFAQRLHAKRTRKMFLAKIKENRIHDLKFIDTGARLDVAEKNLIPFVSDGKVLIVTSFAPYRMCELQLHSGTCTATQLTDTHKEDRNYKNSLHGSSNFVDVPSGFLTLVHFSVSLELGRLYFHRFLLLSSIFPHHPIRLSEPFRFASLPGVQVNDIQFASGIKRVGNELYDVYFGQNDCESLKQRVKFNVDSFYISSPSGAHHKRPKLSVIRWEFQISDQLSYTDLTTNIWGTAGAAEYQMQFRATDSVKMPHFSHFISDNMIVSAEKGLPLANLTVRMHQKPLLHKPARGDLILYLTWGFGTIPQQWLEPLIHHTKEIWVPSEDTRTSLVSSGVPARRVIALQSAVSAELCSQFSSMQLMRRSKSVAFKILFYGSFTFTDGIDVALHGFENAFKSGENVHLTIAATHGDSKVRIQFDHQLSRLPRAISRNIRFIRPERTDTAFIRLAREHHVLYCPHRTADQNVLRLVSGAALGLVPILPDFSAHRAWIKHSAFFFKVKLTVCSLKPCARSGKSMPELQLNPVQNRAFTWYEATHRDVSVALRASFINYHTNFTDFQRKSASVHSQVCSRSWVDAQDEIRRRLAGLASHSAAYEGRRDS